MSEGIINPAAMITHIGGLNSVVDTILNLPEIPGGKKLIYTNINLELTALTELRKKEKKTRCLPVWPRLQKRTMDSGLMKPKSIFWSRRKLYKFRSLIC